MLRVISESPTDVAPVFEAIMDSANRLLGTWYSAVFRYDGTQVHLQEPGAASSTLSVKHYANADRKIVDLLSDRLEKDQSLGKATGAPFRLGKSWAIAIDGSNLAFGTQVLVANPDQKKAYAVKYGFGMSYADPKVQAQLGLPTEDETSGGMQNNTVQHFQLGYMTWSPADGVQVHVTGPTPRPGSQDVFQR